jgi:hypothetical protein
MSKRGELKQYLTNITTMLKELRETRGQGTPRKFISIEELVLAHGKYYTPQELPKNFPRMPAKNCYQNAQKLVEEQYRTNYHDDKGYTLTYVEGYAISVIPLLHAWVIDDKGNVIDPTWEDTSGEYFGIAIPMDYVYHMNLMRESYGVLDAWDIGFPLLTGEHSFREDGTVDYPAYCWK